MNKRILTLSLILVAILISGCIEEQVAKPKQEDEITTPVNTSNETGYGQEFIEDGNASIYAEKRLGRLCVIKITIKNNYNKTTYFLKECRHTILKKTGGTFSNYSFYTKCNKSSFISTGPNRPLGGTFYCQDFDPGTYKFTTRLYFKCNESDDLPCFSIDVESNEVELSEEDTKMRGYTEVVDLNGYKYNISGDVSGPISAIAVRDNTAAARVKIGDMIVYSTDKIIPRIEKNDSEDILNVHWASVETGTVTHVSEESLTVEYTVGYDTEKIISKDNILKILDHEQEFAKVNLPIDNVVGIKFSKTRTHAINWRDNYEYYIYEKNDGYFCEFNKSRDDYNKLYFIVTGNYSLGREEIESAIAGINEILLSEFIKIYQDECTESQKRLTRMGNEMGDLSSWELEVSYKNETSVVFDYLNGISFKKLGEVTKYCGDYVKGSGRSFKMRIDDYLGDTIIRNVNSTNLENQTLSDITPGIF